MTPEQIADVLAHISDHMDKRGEISLSAVIKTVKGKDGSPDEYAHLIAVLENDGKHIVKQIPDYGWSIALNPTYTLQNSVITTNSNIRTTNDSVKSLNKHQKWVIWISIAIAGLSTIFIILTYQQQKNDTSQEELKLLTRQVQEQSKSIQALQLSLKEISHSIQNVADSLSR